MTNPPVSPVIRQEVTAALRRGTVPRRGLELIATGTDRFTDVFDEELAAVAEGGSNFKAIRGPYGCGKSFTARWIQARALAQGFAVAEVQISENDTPLYQLETIYRRATEGLRTTEWQDGAFGNLLTVWLDTLEDEAIAAGVDGDDQAAVAAAVGDLLETRLAAVSARNPQFAAALRAYHRCQVTGDPATAQLLMAWLMGQPNVAQKIKNVAGIKGDLDHTAAMAFLRGLLAVLRQSGRSGLLLVLDEVETIQRVRSDSRRKSLEALRKLIDDLDSGKFPHLYVLITGTPEFFDGPHGIQVLTPLAQRLHVDFSGDPRWDNPRAVQIRLPPFSKERLVEVGRKVRDLYPAKHPERVAAVVDDALIDSLAGAVAGKLGGKVGVAPRIFLRKLVDGLLDRVDRHPDFDPAQHFELKLDADALSPEEAEAAGSQVDLDHIDLDLG
jgi:hypothetical protein